MNSRINLKLSILVLLFLNTLNLCCLKPLENNDLESENEINKSKIDLSPEDSDYLAIYAKQMLSYMNQSVDPCEDFYEYACGNWKNVIVERSSPYKRNNMYDITYKISAAMDEILQRSSNDINPDFGSEFKMVQNFYNLCLRANLTTPTYSADYLAVINQIGGFPALDDTWNPDNFSWFNMSAHLTSYGVESLIREEIIPYYPFPPYFKIPELGLGFVVHSDNIATNTSNGYTFNEKQMRKYLTAYGVQEPKISAVILGVFDFWREVLKLAEQFDDDLNVCREMEFLSGLQNFTQWNNYFDIAWKGKNFNMTRDDFPCDHYYIELDKICGKHKPAVANYLAMTFLHKTDAKITAEKFQKQFCINHAVRTAPYLMDELYLQDYFTSAIREEVVLILKEIRKSLETILKEADWLDEETRREALLKESTLIYRIGKFEDKVLTKTLIRAMDNLKLFEDSYERSNINALKFRTFTTRYLGLHSEQYNNQTKPLELLIATQVNAGYYNLDNSINVLAGILHPPAYHKSWPNALKFGTLGFLIGHEFTHGFDSTGSRYDSSGTRRYWWSEKSGNAFDERASCFAKHFGGYLIPEINRHVNGVESQDENIADNGGLREALHAYRVFIKELVEEQGRGFKQEHELMPGIDLSSEQLFFLGFGQLWCSAYKEEHYWQELAMEHTIDKYRVLGSVTNYEEFAKVFKCPLGSKMNPTKEKCRVW